MQYSRLHARCGTNYLFLVMAVSILFFAMLPYAENLFLRVLTRLIFLPLVAGLAYEVLKLAAASDALWARIIRAPGLGLQYLTTREPEPAMIEVAIAAFDLAINDGILPQEDESPASTSASSDAKEPTKAAADGAKESDAIIEESSEDAISLVKEPEGK
jgi:uncharacterized protein YqhQ